MVWIKQIASAARFQILSRFVRHDAKIKRTEGTILSMKCHFPVIDNMKCPVVTLNEIINDFPGRVWLIISSKNASSIKIANNYNW